jgi:hypothetical protein
MYRTHVCILLILLGVLGFSQVGTHINQNMNLKDYAQKNHLSPLEYHLLKNKPANGAFVPIEKGQNKESSITCSYNNVLNIGFEQGNFSGWNLRGGINLGGVNNDSIAFGQAAPIAVILNGGSDPVTGYTLISPLGGNYITKLNDSIPSGGVCILETKFRVTNQTRFLKAAFALVFQYTGHKCMDDPYFKVDIANCNSTSGMSEYFTLIQEGSCVGDPLMEDSLNYTFAKCNWRVHCFDFSNYMNSTITLKITMADCDLFGHYGYGYFDAMFEPNPAGSLNYIYSVNNANFSFGQNTSALCFPGSSTINLPLGASSYSCFSGLQTFSSAAQSFSTSYIGNLFIEMPHLNDNCIQQQKITIIQTPVVMLSAPGSSICPYSTSTISVSGAQYYYSFSPPAAFNGTFAAFNPSISTVYTVTGFNSPSCSSNSTLTIPVFSTPPIAISPLSQTICLGAVASLTAIGANTYTWNDSGSGSIRSFTPSNPGNRVLSVNGTDANGCLRFSSPSATITTVPAPIINLPSAVSICPGDSVYVMVTGAAVSNFSWSNGSTNPVQYFKPTSTSIYTVFAVSACNTIITKTIQVIVKPILPIQLTVNSPTSTCNGSSFIVTASGATSYTYIGASTSINNNGIGSVMLNSGSSSFTVLANNSANCSSTSSVISINVLPSPTVVVTPTNAASICLGQTVTFTASGANTYSLGTTFGPMTPIGSVFTVSPQGTTYYMLNSFGSNGCNSIRTFTVRVESPQLNGFTASQNTVCLSPVPSITLAAINLSSGTTYTWNGSINASSIVVSPQVTTSYTLELNSVICGYFTTVKTITVFPSLGPTITAVASASQLCVGQTLTVTATGANSYSYSNFGPSTSTMISIPFNFPNNGTVTVKGFDSFGCPSPLIVLPVNVVAKPVLNSAPLQIICPGNSATISVTGASTYSWSSGQTTSVIVVSPTLSPTSYSAYGFSSNGACSALVIRLVYLYPSPTLTIAATSSVCPGQQALLNVTGSFVSHTWSPIGVVNVNPVIVSPVLPTTYSVEVSDFNGCKTNSSIAIGIYSPPVISLNIANAAMCASNSTIVTVNPSPPGGIITPTSYASYIYGIGTHTLDYFYKDPVTTCTNATSSNFTIFPDPCVQVFSIPETLCTGETAFISTIPPGGILTGLFLTGTTFIPPSAGSYSFNYVYTDINGCWGNACTEAIVDICTGIQKLSENSIQVYPNPFQTHLLISNSGNKLLFYKLLDVNGKVLVTGNLVQFNEIRLEYLSAGFYILQVTGSSENYNYKLIKN